MPNIGSEQEMRIAAEPGFMEGTKFHMIDGAVKTAGCCALYVALPRAVQSTVYSVIAGIFNPTSPFYMASINAIAIPLSTAGFSLTQSVIYPILIYQGGKWILKSAYYIGCDGRNIYLQKQAMDDYRKIFEAELAKEANIDPEENKEPKKETKEGFVLL